MWDVVDYVARVVSIDRLQASVIVTFRGESDVSWECALGDVMQ
jgi:hypothetical protein